MSIVELGLGSLELERFPLGGVLSGAGGFPFLPFLPLLPLESSFCLSQAGCLCFCLLDFAGRAGVDGGGAVGADGGSVAVMVVMFSKVVSKAKVGSQAKKICQVCRRQSLQGSLALSVGKYLADL